MEHRQLSGTHLAAKITKAASLQTYFTIRWLVDRDRVPDAYRAYAYFRWVDNTLDQDVLDRRERAAFIERQNALINACYRGERLPNLTAEEHLLVDLVHRDPRADSPLHAYICNMLAVMAFDADRRGRLISHEDLARYTRWLAIAVTEAMHYFIGHNSPAPRGDGRYLAVTGAHSTHMLRDTLDDLQAGYYNIPAEILNASDIDAAEIYSRPYQTWVRSRIKLARHCFRAGREYLRQVPNPRCRFAGYAYMARFESVLDVIERENGQLRPAYPERKSLGASLMMLFSALTMTFNLRRPDAVAPVLTTRHRPG